MFCDRTKEFLSRNNVEFQDRNIVADPKALDELKRLGLMTTPVTTVDGEVIVGFDEAKLTSVLGLRGS